jgi:tetratricopeptide (TPR) repeat protein
MVAAQIAEKSGNLDAAESFYRDLIRLVPGELTPRQKLANLLMTRKRYFEAADLYAQIVGADPANAEAILQWADALAALGKTDQAIQVLQRVGENAVRYVDAQMKMVRLLLKRGGADPGALNASAESLDIVRPRAQTPEFYRLLGDWWFEAYQLARKGQMKDITRFPASSQRPTVPDIAHQARDAYRHYLRVAPQSDDNEEVIGRIHFGIQHLM